MKMQNGEYKRLDQHMEETGGDRQRHQTCVRHNIFPFKYP